MKILRQTGPFLLGAATLFGIAWFTWEIVSLFVAALKEADAKVTAAVIGGIATVSVGLTAALYTQNQIKRREIDEAHRPKKVALYSGFLKIVQKLMAGNNENVPIPPLEEDELIIYLLEFKTEIILWSSPGVVNAFREFESISGSGGGIEKLLPSVDQLYREMRKDIGLSNRGLPHNHLVKMYLKDPTELDEALAKADL